MQNFPLIRTKKQDKKEGLNNIKYPDILPTQFCFLIVGKPGSGKTYLIEELLLNKDFYYKLFDAVLFISPSNFPDLKLRENQQIRDFDLEKIKINLEQIKKSFEAKEGRKNVLLVFDDVVGDLHKNQSNPFLISLFFNRRHLIPDCSISLIVTTQKFTLIPARFRSNITNAILFQLNKNDFKLIEDELIYIDKSQYNKLLEKAFQKKHGFIYISLSPYGLYDQFERFL